MDREYELVFGFIKWLTKNGLHLVANNSCYYFWWGTQSPFWTIQELHAKYKKGLNLTVTKDKMIWESGK